MGVKMICPKCKSEYVEGFKTCPDCQVELVAEIEEDSEEFVKFITIVKTQNSNLMAIAKSVLEDAGIKYFALGENSLDIIGLGRLIGFNRAAGSAEIKVSEEDFAEAKELLKELLEDV